MSVGHILVGLCIAAALGVLAVRGAAIARERFALRDRTNATLLETATVRIGDTVFRVEVARHDADRIRGLSGRPFLAPGSGMLFIFDREDIHQIWMRDMRFPIDLIWMSGEQVVDVTERLPVPAAGASEADTPRFSPHQPALLVLEVPAGTVAALKIHSGQPFKVTFDGLNGG